MNIKVSAEDLLKWLSLRLCIAMQPQSMSVVMSVTLHLSYAGELALRVYAFEPNPSIG